MSDVAMNQKLAVVATIKNGIAIGAKNIGSILVNILLWVLTIWIPYLNVGTTIGLAVGIVSKASRGEIISPTEIFNPEYRKYMGEFFLTSGLAGVGIAIATAFLAIPGIVLSIAWSQAVLIAVDKGKNPSEAISLSNKCTYGNKGRMFGVYLLFTLVFGIVAGLMTLIPGIGFVLAVVVFLFALFVSIGIQASIYRQLTENI